MNPMVVLDLIKYPFRLFRSFRSFRSFRFVEYNKPNCLHGTRNQNTVAIKFANPVLVKVIILNSYWTPS